MDDSEPREGREETTRRVRPEPTRTSFDRIATPYTNTNNNTSSSSNRKSATIVKESQSSDQHRTRRSMPGTALSTDATSTASRRATLATDSSSNSSSHRTHNSNTNAFANATPSTACQATTYGPYQVVLVERHHSHVICDRIWSELIENNEIVGVGCQFLEPGRSVEQRNTETAIDPSLTGARETDSPHDAAQSTSHVFRSHHLSLVEVYLPKDDVVLLFDFLSPTTPPLAPQLTQHGHQARAREQASSQRDKPLRDPEARHVRGEAHSHCSGTYCYSVLRVFFSSCSL
jgi:hypothetical protein